MRLRRAKALHRETVRQTDLCDAALLPPLPEFARSGGDLTNRHLTNRGPILERFEAALPGRFRR